MFGQRYETKICMEKWIRFLHSTAHTPSLTQYFIQTIWLLLEEPLDTNNRLLVPGMKWSLDERLQTERTTGRLRFFFLILPVIMCIWVSSSFLTFTGKITFCSAAEKKIIKCFKSWTYIEAQCKPRGAGGVGRWEEVKMLVSSFGVGTTDKFNKYS